MTTPREIIEDWTARLMANQDKAEQINAVYKFVIEGEGGGEWLFHCKSPLNICEGQDGNAECTISLSSDDFSKIVTGQLNPQVAYMNGRLRVAGNLQQALKLSSLMSIGK